ncbi:hypothetical protein ACA910_001625 [Epithemia clementina (nom. ined.)]
MLAFQLTLDYPEGRVVEVSQPEPSEAEALIKVLRAGICNTDLEIMKGYMGFKGTLGHEFVGRVVGFHPQTTISSTLQQKFLNRRVCGDINLSCSSCRVCDLKTDRSRNHCPNRTVLGILNKDGTMAEYLTLPLVNLHLVTDKIPNSVAVFCEPLAAACRIVEQNLIRGGGSGGTDKVLILGDGKLGLMVAEALGRHQQGSIHKPILVGKHQHKLDLVKDAGVEVKLLSEITTNTEIGKPGSVLEQYQHQFDVVVDATGSPAGLAMAVSLCRPMGVLVLKSTCAAGEAFFAAPIVIDELHIVGSRCGPFQPALDLLAVPACTEGSLNVEKYLTKAFPLAEAAEALKFAAEKSTLKVQLVCSSDDEDDGRAV